MPTQPQSVVIKFHGSMEVSLDGEANDAPVRSFNSMRELADLLNSEGDAVARVIEIEARKVLPPFVTTYADIRFYPGSLAVAGAVAITSWLGSIAIDATKDELSELVGLTVKRAISRYVSNTIGTTIEKPLELQIDASPHPTAPPTNPSVAAAVPSGHGGPLERAPYLKAILIITLVILILEILRIIDSVVDVTWRVAR